MGPTSSSGIGPLPIVNGVNVMRANWQSPARAHAAMAESLASPAEPPTPGRQLGTLLCGEKIGGGPKKLQQGLVAPDIRTFVWRGEAAVASVPGQQQKEMGVALKKLQRQRGPGFTSDGVVLAAHAQYRDGHFINVS